MTLLGVDYSTGTMPGATASADGLSFPGTLKLPAGDTIEQARPIISGWIHWPQRGAVGMEEDK
jgi:hypothetical protein